MTRNSKTKMKNLRSTGSRQKASPKEREKESMVGMILKKIGFML